MKNAEWLGRGDRTCRGRGISPSTGNEDPSPIQHFPSSPCSLYTYLRSNDRSPFLVKRRSTEHSKEEKWPQKERKPDSCLVRFGFPDLAHCHLSIFDKTGLRHTPCLIPLPAGPPHSSSSSSLPSASSQDPRRWANQLGPYLQPGVLQGLFYFQALGGVHN